MVSIVPVESDVLNIARGNRPGAESVYIIGYNGDVDNSVEDLWPVGGSYVPPTVGMQMEVVSSSANDTSAGTGVRSVEVRYLDSGFNHITETVTMNGTTPVATAATDILRINRLHTETVGSGGEAAGEIDIRHLDDTPIYSRIETGSNIDTVAFATVPEGETAYLTSWSVGVGHLSGNRYARFILTATAHPDGSLATDIFHYKDIIIIQDGSTQVVFQVPIKVDARSDIKISVESDSASSSARCGGNFGGFVEH